MPRLKAAGAIVTAQHFVEEIDDRNVSVYDIWGGDPLKRSGIDTVVFAMTRSPCDALFKSLNGDSRTVLSIGDAVAPRAIEAIIYEAEKAAREI